MTKESSPKRRRTMTNEFLKEVDDLRIEHISPLLPPACVLEEQPISKKSAALVSESRSTIQAIINKADDRIFAIVGPCSVHDTAAAIEYAKKLKVLADEVKDDVFIVLRTYFEKPRTTVGWKGLINDPNLDGSFKINHGIRTARQFLLDVNALGMPCAGEFLDTISPQFIADLVSWGAIGARTTESQVHRELASGLSCPVGFKNGTGGDVQVAVDGCLSATSGHSFLSVTKDGIAAIVHTTGNPGCHVILRGGKSGPNYSAEDVQAAKKILEKGNITSGIMIDCSHGNSKKKHENQPIVAAEIGAQLKNGEKAVVGVMIESNINEGNQKLNIGVTDPKTLKYGVSVTDACINFETTEKVMRDLAAAVRARREGNKNGAK